MINGAGMKRGGECCGCHLDGEGASEGWRGWGKQSDRMHFTSCESGEGMWVEKGWRDGGAQMGLRAGDYQSIEEEDEEEGLTDDKDVRRGWHLLGSFQYLE